MGALDEAFASHSPRVVAWPAGDASDLASFAVELDRLLPEAAREIADAARAIGATVASSGARVRLAASSDVFERLARGASTSIVRALPAEALARFRRRAFRVATARGEIALGPRPALMGVINVTPDSFSDGGRFASVAAAVERGRQLVDSGADVLDVGGESTRPGADDVSEDEEIRRVVPVVRELAREGRAPVSVDTRRSRVAEAALDAGASMVNDVSGLDADPRLAAVVRAAGAAIVLGHMRGTPKTMASLARYDDLLGEVGRSLAERAARAMAAGVSARSILIDPGLGFAKTAEHNLELLRRLPELRSLGYPLVVGPSRKSFVGALTGKPPSERAFGTAAAVAAAVLGGAAMVRVHDVAEMRDVAAVAAAIAGEAVA
jgi:dihydropteroate synthase